MPWERVLLGSWAILERAQHGKGLMPASILPHQSDQRDVGGAESQRYIRKNGHALHSNEFHLQADKPWQFHTLFGKSFSLAN